MEELFLPDIQLYRVSDVRHTEIHTPEPLVLGLGASDVELATEKLKIHKSPGNDQIPAELIKSGGKKIRCEIHKLIISVWNKEEFNLILICYLPFNDNVSSQLIVH